MTRLSVAILVGGLATRLGALAARRQNASSTSPVVLLFTTSLHFCANRASPGSFSVSVIWVKRSWKRSGTARCLDSRSCIHATATSRRELPARSNGRCRYCPIRSSCCTAIPISSAITMPSSEPTRRPGPWP